MQLSDSTEQIKQLRVQEAQLQQNPEESKNLAEKLAAADREMEALREQLAAVEVVTRKSLRLQSYTNQNVW